MKKFLVTLALSLVSALASAADATLSWDAVTQDVNGNAISGVTYNVYTSSGNMPQTIVKGISATSYVLKDFKTGCWYVTAQSAQGESDAPSSVCRIAPPPAVVLGKPAKPTNVKVQ